MCCRSLIAATRTLKARVEVDNRGYVLRPDMFVDLELPVAFSRSLVVPTGAVLDSGLKKTVFVERGEGLFSPREVETGRRFDDRVEIVKGLEAGERIVVSGNFLVSSERRLKEAAETLRARHRLPTAQGNAKTAASDLNKTVLEAELGPLRRQLDHHNSSSSAGDVVVNRIIDFSVKNKFLIFAAVAAACLAGWWSMKHVALDAIPDLSDTQVIVYSQLGPQPRHRRRRR